MKPKFTIITPCYNAENYILETFESVVNQNAITNGRADLEYIIYDGNSSDNTVNIVNEAQKKVNYADIKIYSEKDKGMYHAIVKGIRGATGDICAYINAGDFYSKSAFDIVLDVFDQYKEINWLTGMHIHYNEDSQIVHANLPYKYRQKLIVKGLYGKELIGSLKLPFIQQESTFWKSNMNRFLDYNKLENLKYAGDHYIWYEFSKNEVLKIVEAYLGGFKHHKGQLSENKSKYYEEMAQVSDTPTLFDKALALADIPLWLSHRKVKKFFNKNDLLQFNHFNQEWV
ncbi:glycosyltransferase [Neobacillus sp. NRS-1170]|uniref:glycosyltransferase n=1 Tax=Neobacillus sp. NRS-1170 TaxID=3233898 RepID=UPI003D2C19A7